MDSGKKKSVTTQIHQIYIRATPEAIWSAITAPEWTSRYGYRARAIYDLKPGGAYQSQSSAQMRAMGLPEVIIDGEVVEVNPPLRLVHTLRFRDVLPAQMRICTKFKPEGCTIPTDVRQYPRYPISFIMKLVLAKAAMMLHRQATAEHDTTTLDRVSYCIRFTASLRRWRGGHRRLPPPEVSNEGGASANLSVHAGGW